MGEGTRESSEGLPTKVSSENHVVFLWKIKTHKYLMNGIDVIQSSQI